MTTIAYFGYGSLVNLDSLRTPYISAHRARLTGWQRSWLTRPKVPGSFAPIDGLAFLSAQQAPDVTIDGMVIIDHAASLEALDEREALYDRVELGHDRLEFLDENPLSHDTPTYLYVAQPTYAGESGQILRSYLDVVMQGYYTHFGRESLNRFIETTSNFDCPIYEDRSTPHYPRSVSLSGEEVALFEEHAQTQTQTLAQSRTQTDGSD